MVNKKNIGLGIVFIWFFFGGLGHFFLTEFFVGIMPPWFPWPYFAVYVSGVFEILGALAILVSTYRRLAGIALILLTLAVSPANIHMWLNPELFPEFPEPLLSLRLVLQVALLWCIAWSAVLRRD